MNHFKKSRHQEVDNADRGISLRRIIDVIEHGKAGPADDGKVKYENDEIAAVVSGNLVITSYWKNAGHRRADTVFRDLADAAIKDEKQFMNFVEKGMLDNEHERHFRSRLVDLLEDQSRSMIRRLVTSKGSNPSDRNLILEGFQDALRSAFESLGIPKDDQRFIYEVFIAPFGVSLANEINLKRLAPASVLLAEHRSSKKARQPDNKELLGCVIRICEWLMAEELLGMEKARVDGEEVTAAMQLSRDLIDWFRGEMESFSGKHQIDYFWHSAPDGCETVRYLVDQTQFGLRCMALLTSSVIPGKRIGDESFTELGRKAIEGLDYRPQQGPGIVLPEGAEEVIEAACMLRFNIWLIRTIMDGYRIMDGNAPLPVEAVPWQRESF
ncbi:hypothetical protein OAG62_01155 [bacterium]|nr:hypothetical protein [bacterium]